MKKRLTIIFSLSFFFLKKTKGRVLFIRQSLTWFVENQTDSQKLKNKLKDKKLLEIS